jgi:hypothetical protein
MAVQAQLVTPKPFVLDEVTVTRLKDANNNMDQVRKILRPTINEQIVARRFAEINRAWQETSGEMISEKTKQLVTVLDQMEWGDQESISRSRALKQSLDQLGQTAVRMKFEPPTNDSWWETTQSKAGGIVRIQESTISQLAMERAGEQAQQLLSELDGAVRQHKALLDEVHAKIQNTEEEFKNQQAKLVDIAKPFQFVSLNLEVVVSRFPLLVGLFFGVASLWLAGRWRGLVDSFRLLPSQQTADLPRHLLSGLVPGRRDAGRLTWALVLVVATVPLVWIWISVWQLFGCGHVPAQQLFASGLIGSIAAITGLLYYIYIGATD